jgi:hypothetical protein
MTSNTIENIFAVTIGLAIVTWSIAWVFVLPTIGLLYAVGYIQ